MVNSLYLLIILAKNILYILDSLHPLAIVMITSDIKKILYNFFATYSSGT